jgi:hypothetical protein
VFSIFSLVNNDLSFYLALQQGLASLEATVASVSLMASGVPPQHQSQQRSSTHQRERTASASPAMVELFEGSGVMISPLSLTSIVVLSLLTSFMDPFVVAVTLVSYLIYLKKKVNK